MERKIGEIFNYQDNWYQCIENNGYGCSICHFNFNTLKDICCIDIINIIGHCLLPYRRDCKSVVFRKLEKVGNPIKVENKSYQKIKAYDASCENCAFYNNFSRNCKLSYYINHYPEYSCLKDEMFVEIKQNKEGMKEKEEGWVNIYGEGKERYCSNVIYSSKEEALNISKQLKEYITTIKIEWEK